MSNLLSQIKNKNGCYMMINSKDGLFDDYFQQYFTTREDAIQTLRDIGLPDYNLKYTIEYYEDNLLLEIIYLNVNDDDTPYLVSTRYGFI